MPSLNPAGFCLDYGIHFSKFMHEHTPTHQNSVAAPSDRSFGFFFFVFLMSIALYPLLVGGAIRLWFLIIAVFFLLAALFMPKVLAPANRLWMKFGLLINRIVSPFALGIVFYLTVMPIGFLMRLFGKDPLRLRKDPTAESYWIRRDPPGPAADSLDNQF